MEVNLLPHQYESIESTRKFKNTCLLGGGGSGKTYCGSAFILDNCQYDSLGLITANSYRQLNSATLNSVFMNLANWGVPFSYNQQKGLLTINQRKQFLCLSVENFDSHRGIEVSEWWGDEASYYKLQAVETYWGRQRDKRGKLNSLFTCTPRGFNWVFDYFSPSGEKKTNDFNLIKAKTHDNKHLPEDYVRFLRENYDEKLQKQEIDGEFISVNQGQAYYAFNRLNNVADLSSKKQNGVYIGLDFNVDPMCAVIAIYENGVFYIIDEVYQNNSDTYKMCAELQRRGYYGIVIPDSTGNNRKTSGKSDFAIIQEYGFKMDWTRNPFVTDRINNINRLLSKNRIVIDNKCKKLINDLEKVTWRGSELDKTQDKYLSHISDALGYLCHKIDPIVARSSGVTITGI